MFKDILRQQETWYSASLKTYSRDMQQVNRHWKESRVLLRMHLLICMICIALRAINNEFVYGFAQAMDGEKDPRNLMSAFKLVKDIIDNFDISAHVEVILSRITITQVAVA